MPAVLSEIGPANFAQRLLRTPELSDPLDIIERTRAKG